VLIPRINVPRTADVEEKSLAYLANDPSTFRAWRSKCPPWKNHPTTCQSIKIDSANYSPLHAEDGCTHLSLVLPTKAVCSCEKECWPVAVPIYLYVQLGVNFYSLANI
jgi:hypothetical protein